MNIFDIQGLIDNTSTIYTKIEILPKVAGEEIITLTNEDSIKEWVYSDLRNVEKEGFIGQFVARTLDGELQDIADDFNIKDREIVLYLGIFSNHTAELVTQNNNEIITQSNESIITEQGADILTYYKLGNFFVEKPESDEVRDNTKFQAMDYTILFNTPFNADFKDSEYTKSFNEKIEDEETVTALWLAQYTCKQVGVVLGTTTFRNSNFVISSNQFDSGYTCRDVIKSIAKLAITWARIGWDNKLYLDFDKQNTIEDYNVITNDNYYELTTQKDAYGEVNRILMGSSIVIGNGAYVEDTQSIENNGLTELDIYDNPILYTQELREQAVTSASSMLGLMYQPIEVETTGHPWLLGNELITVVDMEGNYLNTYALDRILTYNGHIRTKISSMVKTETESTYSYQGVENNDLEIKRSKVELDRQNQTLTSVMERTTTNESNISTMTQSINGISANITTMSGNITTLQGNVVDLSGDLEDITSSLTTITGDITDLSSDLNDLSVSFEDFYDNEYIQTIADLQDQIDGAIEFWTGDAIPTLNNAPASSWTTEALKQEHIGDVYIVLSGQSQGANYRFVKDDNTWKWLEISDSQIGAVRELAQSAMNKATANEADIVDLKATDVSLQASINGISASVTTLQTNVNNLGNGFDAITTAEKTLTGNPILIPDCGEYLIRNLTIYGNTYQTQSRLPEGYTEVEYIQTSGTQWLDTGLYPSANLKVETKVEVSSTNQDTSVFGSTITTSGNSLGGYYHLTPYNNKWYYGGNNTEGNGGTYSPVIGTQYEIIFNDDNNGIQIDGTSIANNKTFTGINDSTLTIAKRGSANNSRYGRYKYFYFKIYDKTTNLLVRDFIPCYRTSDSEIGMYDIINGVFYTNKGTGVFTKGKDVYLVTSTTPQDVQGVTGEHTLTLRSNNLYHIPNITKYYNGVTLTINDNIITLNGTSTSSSTTRFYLDEEVISLPIGTYTITCWVEGTANSSYAPYIQFVNGDNDLITSFYHQTSDTFTSTFTISEPKENCQIWVDVYNTESFEDYNIKIQIERGSTSTSYSNLYVEPINYSYNLSDLSLHGMSGYKDYITYNLTDETWYLHKNIKEFDVASNEISGGAESSDMSDYVAIYVYTEDGAIDDIKSVENNIYCNKFIYKGLVDNISSVPEEEGLFIHTVSSGTKFEVYLSILKTSMGKQAGEYINQGYIKNWLSTQGIKFYYVQEEEQVEVLDDNNLISDLNYIRDNAKLYNTAMVVTDTPTTGVTGDIGINYLTDTVFNSVYASRSELKITQNSISTTVSETVNAVVENIDNRVTDVANTLEQNSKDLSGKIDNINDSLGEYAKQSSLVTVTNSVQEIQTALNEQILVTQQIKEDGVEKVTTTTGFTFDKDGLTIDKTGADTKTVVDEDGMTVYSKTGSENSVLLNVDSQGVQTENLHVRTFTQIGSHTRLQDYEDGTAIFYIE